MTLVLRHEASGKSWRLWPEPEVPSPGDVRETEQYVFDLTHPLASQIDLLIDDMLLEPLRTTTADTARWRWSPGFHAGQIEVALRIPGTGTRRIEVVTDPDSRKLTRSDFETMVREILQDTYSLFSLSPFRLGISKGSTGKPPPISRLEFIRSRIETLEAVLGEINRRPRRTLTAEDTPVPYHRAPHATAPEILRSFRSGDIRYEHGGVSRLPASLRGFLPAKLSLRVRRTSNDILEHRQMAACLCSWAAWLSVAGDTLSQSVPNAPNGERTQMAAWANRCYRLSRRVTVLGALEVLRDVGHSTATLSLTPIFRNDPAYQRFYQIWKDVNAALAAVFGEFLNMPLGRTYDLYELWCFLRFVAASVRKWGADKVDVSNLFITDAAGGVTIANGAVSVAAGEDWALYFQNPIREYWLTADRRGSYSRTMTPDIVFGRRGDTRRKPSRLIVLDAKYRVDQGLNDAISSIHMYRDAIVQELTSQKVRGAIKAAYLIAPFLPQLGDDFRDTAMPSRLFHPVYRRAFRFGAIVMRPGMVIDDVGAIIDAIIADAGVA
ncbi:MAG: DUF2357 domain-containing protein [Burkholderiaceae bacterium]|nr:DUF2357 domain-containing protein [Burkholderiaceae bacterium]